MEIDMMGEENFKVGVHRRAGVGSHNNCCTSYVFEIWLRESTSQLGVCCVHARLGNAHYRCEHVVWGGKLLGVFHLKKQDALNTSQVMTFLVFLWLAWCSIRREEARDVGFGYMWQRYFFFVHLLARSKKTPVVIFWWEILVANLMSYAFRVILWCWFSSVVEGGEIAEDENSWNQFWWGIWDNDRSIADLLVEFLNSAATIRTKNVAWRRRFNFKKRP